MEEREVANGTHSASQVPNPEWERAVFSTSFLLCRMSWNSVGASSPVAVLQGPPQPPLSIVLTTGVLSPQTQSHSHPPPTHWTATLLSHEALATGLILSRSPPDTTAPLASEIRFQSPGPPCAQKLGLNVSQVAEGPSQAFLMPPAHPSMPQSPESLL